MTVAGLRALLACYPDDARVLLATREPSKTAEYDVTGVVGRAEREVAPVQETRGKHNSDVVVLAGEFRWYGSRRLWE